MDFFFRIIHTPFMLIPIFYFIASWVIVAFGQPAFSFWVSILAAAFGFGLFLTSIQGVESGKKRFWLGVLWFGGVQAVQLAWFISHPYLYIWGVYIFLILALGMQWGVIAWIATKERILRTGAALGLSGLWVFMEVSRLYFLSGFSWNPIGLSLTATLYPLQAAALAGIYGLSFWVLWTNLRFYAATVAEKKIRSWVFWVVLALLPYFIGYLMVYYHDRKIQETPPKIHTSLLVQTAFPIEECLGCPPEELRKYVLGEWRQILRTLSPYTKEKIDLVALPEYVVPFGTWTPVFSWFEVKTLFEDYWGEGAALILPPLEEPWAFWIKGEWWVSNAFLLQGIANHFNADVLAGLEDAERVDDKIEHYNAALYFEPWRYGGDKRYVKRVLVPMGEYIPFEWCREMALSYGIGGSFTPGKKAEVLQGTRGRYGLSICYEETYADLMRENKGEGADILVNLTSDVWYPNSRLPAQHRDHAKLRTTEMGLPLLRACNTGITCGIDSLGREVATLGEEEWKQAALKVRLPLYSYFTPYSWTGDKLILGFSFFAIFLLWLRRKR